VILKANINTGLNTPVVFYIGHAAGEISGSSPYRVGTPELSTVQAGVSSALVPLSDNRDIDKSRRVGTVELVSPGGDFKESRSIQTQTSTMKETSSFQVQNTVTANRVSSEYIVEHLASVIITNGTDLTVDEFVARFGKRGIFREFNRT